MKLPNAVDNTQQMKTPYNLLFDLITNNEQQLEGKLEMKIESLEGFDQVVFDSYTALFRLLKDHKMQLIFVRHKVPNINVQLNADYKTTYELFNKGRFLAFRQEFGSDSSCWEIPAATAVGSCDLIFSVEFKAIKTLIKRIENLQQIPARKYSRNYGIYPPVFSRGCIAEENGIIKLFASGTASIKGEASQYNDSLYDQIYNTIENLRVLGSQLNLKPYGIEYGFAVEDIRYLIVYYRHDTDLSFLKRFIPQFLSPQCIVKYSLANICREELLVEMEAIFHKKGYENASKNKYYLENGRIRTESFELHICEHCNLKCEECCNMSPFNSSKSMTLQEVESISSFVNENINPDVIKISGGEPLLHAQLDEIVQLVKFHNPDTKIRVTSNGLLFHKLNCKVLESIDQLWISNYKSAPISTETLSQIKKLSKDHEIILNIKNVNEFNRIFLTEPSVDLDQIQQIYNDCWMRHRCLMIRNNTFYKCTRAAYIDDLLNMKLGKNFNYSGMDGISLLESDFKKVALDYLNSTEPLNSCKYCLGVSGELFENKQIKAIRF